MKKKHSEIYGPNKEELSRVIRDVLQDASKNKKDVLVRVGSIDNMKGVISDVMGGKNTNKLIKDKCIPFSETCNIYFEGDRTKKSAIILFDGSWSYEVWRVNAEVV